MGGGDAFFERVTRLSSFFFEDDAAIDSNHELFGTMDELNKPISSYSKFIIVDTWSIPKLSSITVTSFDFQVGLCKHWIHLYSWLLVQSKTIVHLLIIVYEKRSILSVARLVISTHTHTHTHTHTIHWLPMAQKILPKSPPIWSCSVFSYPPEKLTYPTLGKGKSSSKVPLDGIC